MSHQSRESSWAAAAEFYDLIYGDKDYRGEAQRLAETIRARAPGAERILDVGCGPGQHARALVELDFSVDGLDLEASFLEQARAKNPAGTFSEGDMAAFSLPGRYDAVVSLFSAIGYVVTESRLRSTLVCMASHLAPGGLVVVEPWFEPGQLTNGWITVQSGKTEHVEVVRMSRTVVLGSVSRLEFEYLIGRADGIERRSEVHELGLFTEDQMESAFTGAGLLVEHVPGSLRNRGLYVGSRAEGGA